MTTSEHWDEKETFQTRDEEAKETKAKFNIFHKTKTTTESADVLHDEIKYLQNTHLSSSEYTGIQQIYIKRSNYMILNGKYIIMSFFLCQLLSVYHLSGMSYNPLITPPFMTRYWQIQSLGDPVQLTIAVGSQLWTTGVRVLQNFLQAFLLFYYFCSICAISWALKMGIMYIPFMAEYPIVIYSLDLTLCKSL